MLIKKQFMLFFFFCFEQICGSHSKNSPEAIEAQAKAQIFDFVN